MCVLCYLKEVNEQTTAASVTEKQEHEEWEENERRDEQKEGEEPRLCSTGPLWLLPLLSSSNEDERVGVGVGEGVGRARVVANRHTDWASPVEAPLVWRRHKCYVSTPCDFKAADGCKYTCSTNFCTPGRSAWVTLGQEMSRWQKVQTGHMNA